MFKYTSLLATAVLLLASCNQIPNNPAGQPTDMPSGTPSTDPSAEPAQEMMFTVTIENISSGDTATPFAPGVFVVHSDANNPLFMAGEKDKGMGLEALAEDGDAAPLAAATQGTVFNMPVGDTEPGPATPGKSYSFSFTAKPGDHLSFASMYVQSNDAFIAADSLPLFTNGQPMMGDVTSKIMLWDSGTEVNQEPFVGADQAPRQAGPNTGASEELPVQLMSAVGDGFTYPAAAKVTISAK